MRHFLPMMPMMTGAPQQAAGHTPGCYGHRMGAVYDSSSSSSSSSSPSFVSSPFPAPPAPPAPSNGFTQPYLAMCESAVTESARLLMEDLHALGPCDVRAERVKKFQQKFALWLALTDDAFFSGPSAVGNGGKMIESGWLDHPTADAMTFVMGHTHPWCPSRPNVSGLGSQSNFYLSESSSSSSNISDMTSGCPGGTCGLRRSF